MKRAQIIGFAVALVAGGGAFFLARSMTQTAPAPMPVAAPATDTVQVLVARTDIGLGQVANESSFRWQEWPKNAVSPQFMTRQSRPKAATDLSGAVARTSITANEPITGNKLIKPGSGGVLAAILTPGMRAISIKIAEHTSVGRMILPNDYVDLLLTTRTRARNGSQEDVSTEVLLRNVRILAIGQMLEVKDGRKNAEGNVASLELTPSQAELIAQSSLRGEINLLLRSIADIGGAQTATDDRSKERANSIRVLRYGVRAKAYGVQ
ncbi:MAG: Flp pilus assembly protein CpaB [Hyphomicrobiaceae bacterium]